MNRRTYIEKALRGGLLAVLIAGTGLLVSRRQVSLESKCEHGKQCAGCGKLGRCALPEAESQRNKEVLNG